MAINQQDIDSIPLWEHQRQAIETVSGYVRRSNEGKEALPPASLVNIPTGGGKSAIIAIVAHSNATPRKVLVLTPRIGLRKQLTQDLLANRGVLTKLGEGKARLRTIKEITSVGDLDNIGIGDADIIVSTIQLIQTARRKASAALDRLSKLLGCVLVDEGHYEPARSWSLAIRSLGAPTVLFTATPYRNDLRTFTLDPAAVHVTSYERLQGLKILRHLEIVDIPVADARDTKKFVSSVLRAFQTHYGGLPSSDRRLIIRCRSKNDIRAVQQVIAQQTNGQLTSIGIHERFRKPSAPYDSAQAEYSQPPSPEVCPHPIWIHQYKLLEGIDGPCFRAVSIHGSLGSARSLIQQIGRILRNPERIGNESALLIDHSDGSAKRRWERYLSYDSTATPDNISQSIQEIIAAFEINLPATIYTENDFRSRYTMEKNARDDILKSIRLPARCSLIRTSDQKAIKKIYALSTQRLHEADIPYHLIKQDKDEFVITFVRIGTSPYLAEHYFIEKKLHIHVARRSGNMIAILDTSRNGVPYDVQKIIGPLISRGELSRVLSGGNATKFTEIKSRNTSLGASSTRTRAIQAQSLDASPPMLDDLQFAPSTLTTIDSGTGVTRGHSVRSLGFGNARVTDQEPLQTIEAWSHWVDALMKRAQTSQRRAPLYLERFAKPLSQPPRKPQACSVLFDASRVRENFIFVKSALRTEEVTIDDAYFTLITDPMDGTKRNFGADALLNGKQIDGYIQFEPSPQRYVIHSELLQKVRMREDRTIDLAEHLNSTQALSIVPDEAGVIYSEGTFFDPKIPLGDDFDEKKLGFSGTFETVPHLAGTFSEKGGKASATSAGWAAGSVFAWIDANAGAIVPGLQLLVYDDGTAESCDFIAVGERGGTPLVTLIHAKASKTRNHVGASPLHEVCSQAVKNLGVLNMFSPNRPKQADKWRRPWDGPGGEGQVKKRVRRDAGIWSGKTGPAIWERLEDLIRNPDTQREVVIVLGASLNVPKLFREAKSKSTKPVALQTLHLLRSTLATTAAAGARLRIWCG